MRRQALTVEAATLEVLDIPPPEALRISPSYRRTTTGPAYRFLRIQVVSRIDSGLSGAKLILSSD